MDLGLALTSGILVSAFVQIVKQYVGDSKLKTYALLLIGSLIAGFAYQYLVNTDYWPLVVSSLVSSQAVYTFLIKHFETE